MFRRNIIFSRALIILSIMGGINLIISTMIFSPLSSTAPTVFATTSSSQPSVGQDISNLFKGIEQFIAPSGYQQAREDPSYAINIPFSDQGFSPFEPSIISIPANMGVIWFNEDDSPQSVTFNATNPEAIQSVTIAPGGFFIHKFTVPGTYVYYNSENPSAKGIIMVGSEFESGQYMDMLVGGDALPFESGAVGRTTFSFVPHDNVTTIPPTLSITYNVTIVDSNGTQLYSNQFEDSDGILDLELVPTSSSRSSLSSSSNQTTGGTGTEGGQQPPHFVTWGPDLTDQEGVASDGAYHVQGPVLTENEDYTITVSITNIDNAVQPQPLSDDFLLPSVNFTANSTAANFLGP
jgi:plastocyanin